MAQSDISVGRPGQDDVQGDRLVQRPDLSAPAHQEARDHGGPGQGILAHRHTEHARWTVNYKEKNRIKVVLVAFPMCFAFEEKEEKALFAAYLIKIFTL